MDLEKLAQWFGLKDAGTLAQWFGAVATSGAVIVALFKEAIVSRWRRPELELSAILAPPHCHQIPLRSSTLSVASYWFRFWVENSGKTRATEVQVWVDSLSRRLPDGTFEKDSDFLPMNLIWSHTHEIYASGISPGMGKHCDLGRIVEPKHQAAVGDSIVAGVPSNKTVLNLSLEVKPTTGSHLVQPGTYRIALKVAAANTRPTNIVIELVLTGDWFNDEGKMFKDGIRMKVV